MASSIAHNIDGEYIREWLVLGPFFPDDLDRDFLADAGGEANVQPKEGDTVITADGKILKWERYSSRKNIVDLMDAIGNHQFATAYAFCILQSETGGDGEIRLGNGAGAAAVWVNGEQTHTNADRLFTLDEDTFEVNVKVGANHCMIKVYREWYAEWFFAIRVLPPDRAVISGIITDEKGKPMPDAHVRLDQDWEEVIQTVTDASGHYWVGVYPVSGSYDLFTTADELGGLRLGIQLDAGERLTLKLTLKEAVSIEGTVLMLDDTTPHIAVPVQAIRDGRVAATVLTDERGEYRFINLKPGQYQQQSQCCSL